MGQYDEELPFVKDASERCKQAAERRGYIKLIDGARCHFDQWEVSHRNWEEESQYKGTMGVAPCSLVEAQARVDDLSHPWKGRIVRAYTHKAFNRAVQGSAARQTKISMRNAYQAGIIPLLQMHDELCGSFTSPEQGAQLSEIMRDAVKLTVPMKTDAEYGINWGTARKIETKDKKILYDASWTSAKRLQSEGKWW
jgi:DNA polymerase I-like protein with 3'-5' exonuclease and polymerase domains